MLQEAISYSIPASESVRLLQLTDPHLFADRNGQLLGVNTVHSLQAVLNSVKDAKHKADMVLATGDISQDYSPQSYQHFAQLISQLALPCHYLPGNHDNPQVMHLHMQDKKLYGEQRILAGNWQILMLNSTILGKPSGRLAQIEFELIDKAIAAHPQQHLLLVMHHNPVATGCQWLDQHQLANGEAFLQHISQYSQVKAVLWGHVHQQLDRQYDRKPIPISLMATPSTCIQFKPASKEFALDTKQPGYRLLDLHADGSMTTCVYRIPGEEFSPDKDASGY